MTKLLSMPLPVDLRQRMIEDMNVREFSAKTQHDYLRIVSRFAAVLGRSLGTETAEEVRPAADKGRRARGALGRKGDGREICCPPTLWRDGGRERDNRKRTTLRRVK